MPARALGSRAGGSNLRVTSAATLASSSRSSLTSILVPSLGRPSGRRSSTSAGDGASHDGPWGSPVSAGAPTDTKPVPVPVPVPAADRLSATSARPSAVVTRRSNSRILLLASASSASARRALSSAANALSSASPPPRLSGTGSLSGTGAVCVRGGGG